MIDVFMISILVAVVRFPFFARVMAETGVIFFAAVVILTIFAADLYDPREMWDAAGLNDDHASSFSRDEKVEPLSGSDEMEPKRA
ncbi:paraquat-inducible protein A [Saccharibacter floricola DSM 15669]|uniref:Paraquat-inducible protein A n=2 Tax=Saccharibacter TaxID=231052 RepID=A0ABQ0NYF7_9PROT|nr:paraquat-inducible protein A [Saccharibacter floricola DSM 15669]